MKKPTPKEISRKTTWSPEDEVEFFDAMDRARSDHARINLLLGRAKSIGPAHPKAGIKLYEMVLDDHPGCQDYHERDAVRRLTLLSAQIGEAAAGGDRMKAYAEDRLAQDRTALYALQEYLNFVADTECASHYQSVIDLVPRAEHVRAAPPPARPGTAGTSWTIFCGAAYFAHLLGDTAVCEDYLEKAKDWQFHDNLTAHDVWRLWLFQQAQMGARSVTPALVRPEFTLAEMRDWAEGNWTKFRPEISYSETKDGERLILAWDAFIVDLTISYDPKRAKSALSFFRKKNLGKFETDRARELKWKDAGDYDAVDAINTSIELLDYFKTDARIAVNIG